MDLSDLINVPAIMPALKANSKKQLLQLLSERAAAISGAGGEADLAAPCFYRRP